MMKTYLWCDTYLWHGTRIWWVYFYDERLIFYEELTYDEDIFMMKNIYKMMIY